MHIDKIIGKFWNHSSVINIASPGAAEVVDFQNWPSLYCAETKEDTIGKTFLKGRSFPASIISSCGHNDCHVSKPTAKYIGVSLTTISMQMNNHRNLLASRCSWNANFGRSVIICFLAPCLFDLEGCGAGS